MSMTEVRSYPEKRPQRRKTQQRDSATMDIFQGPLYRLNRRLLFYFGQWPLQSQKERNFYRSITVLLVGSIVVPKVIRFSECLGDANMMIQCLPVLGLHARSIVNFLNCTVNAKEMKQLTDLIKDGWASNISKREDSIARRYAKQGRLLTISYSTYMFTALVMYLSLPLVPTILDVFMPLNRSRDRIYLYETEYFIDRDENYMILLAHACLTMPFSLGMIIAYYTMFAVYVHHACGIFAKLGARLETVTTGDIEDNGLKFNEDSGRWKDETYEEIVTCIKMHKTAIKFTDLIESSGNVCYLIVVGINMLSITLTGFMTVTNLDQPAEALRYGAFAFGEIVHLFYVCWQGQMVIEHSQHIFIDVNNINWYAITPRAKKLLIVMMIRCLEPRKLTAGKIYVLSLENFAMVLKTSMSYFTVLLSMQ